MGRTVDNRYYDTDSLAKVNDFDSIKILIDKLTCLISGVHKFTTFRGIN